jgi:hypothetical protein
MFRLRMWLYQLTFNRSQLLIVQKMSFLTNKKQSNSLQTENNHQLMLSQGLCQKLLNRKQQPEGLFISQ